MTSLAATELPALAGYRALRVIGRGERGSEVWLGVDDGHQVALKVASPSVAADSAALGTELAALDRAAGDHVVRLLDLDVTPRATVLVFERLTGGDLAEMLARRPGLAAGEAVTILAPLAATVERMHAAGVAHGRLDPGRVLFRSDGSPTLTGFGAAVLFAAGTPEVVRETVAAVAADRAALVALAAAVLGRVAGPRAQVAGQLAARIVAARPADVAGLIATAAFELAAPLPVRFADDSAAAAAVDSGAGVGAGVGGAVRLIPLLEPAADSDSHRGRSAEAAASGLRAAFGPEGVVGALLERGPTAGVRAAAARHWAVWSVRRRRATLAFAAGVAAVLVAVVVVPDGGGSGGLPVVSASGVVETPGTDVSSTDGSSTDAPTTGAPDPAIEDPRLGDDPLAASAALLELRARCFVELSLLCLDGVDQQGSTALDDDQSEVAAVLAGAELRPGITFDPASAVVTERLGDSALIDLGPGSEPASLLVMRGEAGWRIRDYIAVG